MFRQIQPSALVLCVLSLLTFAHCACADANWPQFRGPDARGVAEGNGLPDRWSATENVAWKADIPGRGWSSPIVWGSRVFLTTVVNQGQSEAPKKGLYLGGNRKDAPESIHQWKVLCLDLETGQVVWERQVHEGKPPSSTHIKNSYASETPVTDGERVYAYFGNVGVWCFDFEGNQVWSKEIAPHKTSSGWGTASSPVLHENRLYIQNDNEEDSYLLACDKLTGEEVWRVPREEDGNWCTPFIWTNEQRTEIVASGSKMVRSYDLEGNVLWSLQGMSGITIATPYACDGLLYISSGYVMDKKRPVYAIRPGASGDISLTEGQTSNQWIAWSLPQAAPYNPSTLVYEELLYVLYDYESIACFNARDGAVVYAAQKLPEGRSFTASPWACGDKVFCLNEDGITFVIKAGSTFEVLGTNPLEEDDMVLATPAIAGDRLLIRTSARLYCIRNSAG
ncbi:MAG: PQQ-binding-like beta-propeller repeat protein [Candidatus Hydrogenedentes bacterium]|nr:PQQ-binding-like beta-propeller repeat protein [Candidatus Hydrogenedentota bacterium]